MIDSLYQVVTMLGTFAAGFGAIFAWRFVLEYRQVNWQKYQAGRHLMSFTKGLAVILTYVVVFAILTQLFSPDFAPTGVLLRHNEWLGLFASTSRLAVFTWLAWQLWDRLQMLERYQNGLEAISDDDTRDDVETESSR